MSLPSGYTELEYIESSGTQYIKTGFKPNNNTRLVMDEQITAHPASTSQYLFGARTDSYTVNFGLLLKSLFRSDYGESKVDSMYKTPLKRLTVDKNKNVCTLTDEIVTSEMKNAVSTFQSNYELYLFASNDGGTADYNAKMRLYSCQIYDNGTLVRDFVPCRNSSNEIGLYDFVNGRFYGNAGNGVFTAGNVVILTPSAPSHFSAESGIGSVFLEWTEAENSDGYRLYRNGVLIADTASTAYTDEGLESYSGVRYELVPYNDSGDGGSVTADVIIKGRPRPLSDLVIDRTAADAATKTRKGVYNAFDLNRVSAAAAYVHGLLDELGYASPKTPARVWHVNDIPDRGEMNAHHNAVVVLDVIRYAHEKVVLPPNLEKLTYERANNIEKFLLLCGEAAERIPAAYIYSDEFFGGELS